MIYKYFSDIQINRKSKQMIVSLDNKYIYYTLVNFYNDCDVFNDYSITEYNKEKGTNYG